MTTALVMPNEVMAAKNIELNGFIKREIRYEKISSSYCPWL